MFVLQLYSISCLNTMSIPFCATYCTLSRCILPDILAFYESEEGQREFAEWKKQREAERREAENESIRKSDGIP